MTTKAILQAAQSILQTAVNGLTPKPTATIGVPKTVNDQAVLYLFHDGYTDTEKTNDLVLRTHTIGIHLLLREPADSQTTELAFADFNDAIAGAYYTNRKLNNTAQTSALKQSDGNFSKVSQSSAYTIAEGATYRQRWWSLEAVEYVGYTMH
jgi:hypothetical protein